MNTDSPFKVGDVVRLKSGGPKMIVSTVAVGHFQNDPTLVACVWH
jgi:uncharacterized protein YodC (DUF2158 family)